MDMSDDDILDLESLDFEDVFESLTLSNSKPRFATIPEEDIDDLLNESPPESMHIPITHSTSQDSINTQQSQDSRRTLTLNRSPNTSNESLTSDHTVSDKSWKHRSGSFRQRLDERRLDEQRMKKSTSLIALATIDESTSKNEISKTDSGINFIDQDLLSNESLDMKAEIDTRPPILRSSNNRDLFSFQTNATITSNPVFTSCSPTRKNTSSKSSMDSTPKKLAASRLRPPTPVQLIQSQYNSPTVSNVTSPIRKSPKSSIIPKPSPSPPKLESPSRIIGKKYNSFDTAEYAVKYRKTTDGIGYRSTPSSNIDRNVSRIAVIVSPHKQDTTSGISRLEQLRQKYSKK